METLMELGIRHRRRGRSSTANRGFTLLELLFTVLIGIVLTVIALPLVQNVMTGFKLRSAVASVTGAIQTTRYQAISSGYAFRVVLDKTASTIQVQSDPNRTGTFANTGSAIPLASSSIPVVLGTSTTLQFRPSGVVTATTGSTTLTLTYGGKTETITVSSYGNIKVTP
jgi:Tfp pilus assembly protein FimT